LSRILTIKSKILNSPVIANNAFLNLLYVCYAALKVHLSMRFSADNLDASLKARESDTLVIIGAGDSINRLSNSQWKELEQYDVAGLSYSCLLPIKQDMYFYEVPTDSNLLSEHKTKLIPLLQKFSLEGKIKQFIFKVSNKHVVPTLKDIGIYGIKYISVNAPANSVGVLKRVVRILDTLKLYQYFMMQYRGSVFGISLLAHLRGYKRIIFVGIDLNGSPYFFENQEQWSKHNFTNPIKVEGKVNPYRSHPTADNRLAIPIDQALKNLSVATGIEMFVSHPESLLSQHFPLWHFRKS